MSPLLRRRSVYYITLDCCESNTNCVGSATDDFNHGVVLSNRPLRSNEVFQVRIDKMVDKWAGSIEIGVTTHNPAYLQLPSTMTNLRSGEAANTPVGTESGRTGVNGYVLFFRRHVDDDRERRDAQWNDHPG